MLRKKVGVFKYFSVIFALMILVTSFTLITAFAKASDFKTSQKELKGEEKIVVLFDEAHGQKINSSLMKKALEAINSSENYEVYLNDKPLSYTNLYGVDILIITNPSNTSTFSSDEKLAVEKFVTTLNGSLFLLSNPVNLSSPYSGTASSLNSLLQTLEISELLGFAGGVHTNVIIDPVLVKNEPFSYILVNRSNFRDLTFVNEPENVDSLLVYSCSLRGSLPATVATANLTAYVLNADYEVSGADGEPVWLQKHIVGNDTRMLLCGSTIMFSDLNVSGTDKSWFESENNGVLWKNLIEWLAHKTPIIVPEKEDKLPRMDLIIIIISFAMFGVTALFRYKIKALEEEPISVVLERMREKKKETKEEKPKPKIKKKRKRKRR